MKKKKRAKLEEEDMSEEDDEEEADEGEEPIAKKPSRAQAVPGICIYGMHTYITHI